MPHIRITEKIIVRCTPEFVFDYTQDYAGRLKWDTFLKKAELLDGAIEAGVGVRADCVAKNGFGMITEYVSFNRPDGTAVKMTKGPIMFRSFAGSWKFTELDAGLTEVSFIYSYELRWPFSMFHGMFKNKLRSEVRQRLVDLKRNIEANIDHSNN
ncbi:MAG TPA: SRPBCC family protein [Ignavibacteria bacterium]|nr:SRPBCC family protein [Bacteroidota bacterium]HRE10621.1 SRPBCC family protein [Ignavibacteria bacterium]HRF67429.1 SRPBCC family protein [Ignavibacteria bacterium]HRJ05468.1 SRPBCC family protein [Ignavibacteria bacterium]HRJ86072.1 SRPBCC family protein [Ignavibacteria bacterium]